MELFFKWFFYYWLPPWKMIRITFFKAFLIQNLIMGFLFFLNYLLNCFHNQPLLEKLMSFKILYHTWYIVYCGKNSNIIPFYFDHQIIQQTDNSRTKTMITTSGFVVVWYISKIGWIVLTKCKMYKRTTKLFISSLLNL